MSTYTQAAIATVHDAITDAAQADRNQDTLTTHQALARAAECCTATANAVAAHGLHKAPHALAVVLAPQRHRQIRIEEARSGHHSHAGVGYRTAIAHLDETLAYLVSHYDDEPHHYWQITIGIHTTEHGHLRILYHDHNGEVTEPGVLAALDAATFTPCPSCTAS